MGKADRPLSIPCGKQPGCTDLANANFDGGGSKDKGEATIFVITLPPIIQQCFDRARVRLLEVSNMWSP